MRPVRAVLAAILLTILGMGLGLSRSTARDLATPLRSGAGVRVMYGGRVAAPGGPSIGFKVCASAEPLLRPGYEACLARIDAADARLTVSFGEAESGAAAAGSGIALVADSLAAGMRSAVGRWLATAPSGSSGSGGPGTGPCADGQKPGSAKKPPVIPDSWKITLLTGYSCWWGTCKYTCSNVVTCSTTVTCYATTCENHHTCSPGAAPQGCGNGEKDGSNEPSMTHTRARGLAALLR